MDLDELRERLGDFFSTSLFTLSGTEVTVASVGVFLLGVGISIILAMVVRRALQRALQRGGRVDPGVAVACDAGDPTRRPRQNCCCW